MRQHNLNTHVVQDLVTAILDIMGLSADAVSDNDSLASIGIDSLQLVEVTFHDICSCMNMLLLPLC